MDYFDFDKEKVEEYARMCNQEIEIIYISAKTGEGIPKLSDWIIKNVNDWNK
jgi:hydrogenase nickel incorporation protein HypB